MSSGTARPRPLWWRFHSIAILFVLALGASVAQAEGTASTVGLPPEPAVVPGAYCTGPGCAGRPASPAVHAAGFGMAALGAARIARRRRD